ncbi:MAG: hypothetical protein RLZZ58_827 [Pseudomonadota bacterium]|jgi:prevent-host-death family protein
MGIRVNIGEAKTRLSELIAASLRGEDVVLSKAGKPVARLVGIADAMADEAARSAAARAEKIKAWIGSGKGRLGPQAGDLFLTPAFSDDDLDDFGKDIGA